MTANYNSSILINGVHWNWEKVDPGEFDKWKILEEQKERLEMEMNRLNKEQAKCVERTRAKYNHRPSLQST